jgi:hypothetical protein
MSQTNERPYDVDAIVAALLAEQIDMNAARATLRKRSTPRGEGQRVIKAPAAFFDEAFKQFGDSYFKDVPPPRRRT